MSTPLGDAVKAAISTHTQAIIDQVVAGTLPPEAAVSGLAAVIDMAVRRDPAFADAIGLKLEEPSVV